MYNFLLFISLLFSLLFTYDSFALGFSGSSSYSAPYFSYTGTSETVTFVNTYNSGVTCSGSMYCGIPTGNTSFSYSYTPSGLYQKGVFGVVYLDTEQVFTFSSGGYLLYFQDFGAYTKRIEYRLTALDEVTLFYYAYVSGVGLVQVDSVVFPLPEQITSSADGPMMNYKLLAFDIVLDSRSLGGGLYSTDLPNSRFAYYGNYFEIWEVTTPFNFDNGYTAWGGVVYAGPKFLGSPLTYPSGPYIENFYVFGLGEQTSRIHSYKGLGSTSMLEYYVGLGQFFGADMLSSPPVPPIDGFVPCEGLFCYFEYIGGFLSLPVRLYDVLFDTLPSSWCTSPEYMEYYDLPSRIVASISALWTLINPFIPIEGSTLCHWDYGQEEVAYTVSYSRTENNIVDYFIIVISLIGFFYTSSSNLVGLGSRITGTVQNYNLNRRLGTIADKKRFPMKSKNLDNSLASLKVKGYTNLRSQKTKNQLSLPSDR